MALSPWQKKQAALLYHFSSLNYLKEVKARVDLLMDFSKQILDRATVEDRDSSLRNSRWGSRDTSENWGNNAWSCLADFQLSLSKDIANRAVEVFSVTGRNHCARALAEYSREWTTDAEQQNFDSIFSALTQQALDIDQTMNKIGPRSKWPDFSLTMAWQKHARDFQRLPMLQVRTDIFAETGQVPVRTGVYYCADDPNATLQFAWAGNSGGHLLEASTFNDLGNDALASITRSNLWIDGPKMLDFVKSHKDDLELRSDSFFEDSLNEDLAPSLVARHAFEGSPCRWHNVEMIHGEFEVLNEEPSHRNGSPVANMRYEAGSSCPVSGYYFTPANDSSRRYFSQGDLFPEVISAYGKVFWQFDIDQRNSRQ